MELRTPAIDPYNRTKNGATVTNTIKLNARSGDKAGWWNFIAPLRHGISFETSGNFYGKASDFDSATGRMGMSSTEEMEAYKDAFYAGTLEYVVYSYATPIAWKVSGVWTVTTSSYSDTTKRHINKIAVAIEKVDDPSYR